MNEESFLLTLPSRLTGKLNTMPLPADADTVLAWLVGRERGERVPLVQDAFPHFSRAQREFLLTGSTPQEWDEHIGEPED